MRFLSKSPHCVVQQLRIGGFAEILDIGQRQTCLFRHANRAALETGLRKEERTVSAIRFSLGRFTTVEEIDQATETVVHAVAGLRGDGG